MTVKANFVQRGDSIDHTPGSAVAAGDVVVLGAALLGIAKLDIPANTLGALAVVGVFDVVKASGDGGIAAGAAVYWDDTAKVATTTSAANTLMGKALAAAGDTDTSVRVRLSQ